MNDDTTNLDQTDEDILACVIFDEALEAAASIELKSANPATMVAGCTYFC